MLLISILLFAVGLFILIKGANYLVDGASAISLKFKIAPIVIGLTVVAFGTSAPELVVSVTSALSGNTDLALSNIIGSNIANILLIIGISGIITSLKVRHNTAWKEIPMSFLGAVVLTVLGLQDVIDKGNVSLLSTGPQEIVGHISFSNGLILLFFFIIFLYYTFGIANVTGDDEPEIKGHSIRKSILLIVGGLIALIIGSKLAVDNAILIAQTLGLSDTLIGLTLVAVGTSLPEISTSIVAAMKKKVDILVGNVVGSNIFNIFLILGVTALIRPIPLRAEMLTDIAMLFLATAGLFFSLFVARRFRIEKMEGVALLILYGVYLLYIIQRG